MKIRIGSISRTAAILIVAFFTLPSIVGSKVERPSEQLQGFQRVSLQPGETKTAIIPLRASNLAYWNEKQHTFVLEPEPIELMVGNSSADIELKTDIQVQ